MFSRDTVTTVADSNDEAVEEALDLTKFAKTVYLLNPKSRLEVNPDLLVEAEAKENLVIQNGKQIARVNGNSSVKSISFR